MKNVTVITGASSGFGALTALASNKMLPITDSRMESGIIFNAITAVAAATAAAAAATSLTLGLPVWAMFIGWVAFFSRGHSIRDGLINYGGGKPECAWGVRLQSAAWRPGYR